MHPPPPNRSHRPYKSFSFPRPSFREMKLPDKKPTIGLLLYKSAKKFILSQPSL